MDAIYKFLSANADPWNNGDNTRQISINGVRQRLYNLDDTRCPIPGKSYKDLTPKQIEVIYLNYWSIYREISDEEKSYKEALEQKPEHIKHFKFLIQHRIDTASNEKIHYKDLKFKDKNVDEIYPQVMSGEIELIEKSLYKNFKQNDIITYSNEKVIMLVLYV